MSLLDDAFGDMAEEDFFGDFSKPDPAATADVRHDAGQHEQGEAGVSEQIQVIDKSTASQVDAVVNNSMVQSLMGDGLMDEKTSAQCLEIMGYAPPNIMDPRVQKVLFQQNERLKPAFANPMTRGFAIAVNQTSNKICKSILLAAVARRLLDNSLTMMGVEAAGRSDLVQMAVEIQHSMEMIATKTQEFVMVMAKTIKEMGETAFLLEFDANPDKLLEAIQNANLTVVRHSEEVQEAEQLALEPIRRGIEVIKSNLQDNDAYRTKEALVNQLADIHRQQEENLLVLYHEQYEGKTNLKAEDKLLEMQVVHQLSDIELKEKYANGKGADIAVLKQQVQKYVATQDQVRNQVFDETRVVGLRDINRLAADLEKDKVDISQFSDLGRGTMDTSALQEATKTPTQVVVTGQAQMQQFRQNLTGMIKQEIGSRRAVLDQRIQQLEERERSITRQAESFRTKSTYASDGYKNEAVTTTSRSGWWLWRSTTTTTTYNRVKTGYNEKERLQRMASDVEGNLSSIRSELASLRAERDGISNAVRNDMMEQQRKMDEMQAERKEQAIKEARLIDEQKAAALRAADARNEAVRQRNEQILHNMTASNTEIAQRNEKIIRAAQANNERLIGVAREQFFADKKAALELMQKQIEAVRTMLETVENQKLGYEREVLMIQDDVARKTSRRAEIVRELAEFDEEKGEKQGRIRKLERDTEEARVNYERERDALQRFVRRYGISNGEDFAAFMQMFQLLNTSIQNLPAAMVTLSKSFEAANELFSGDFFRTKVQSVPEANRGKLLAKIAVDLQAICELGWQMFDKPMDSLMLTDSTSFLTQLVSQGVQERKQRMIEHAGCHIEEVIEEEA